MCMHQQQRNQVHKRVLASHKVFRQIWYKNVLDSILTTFTKQFFHHWQAPIRFSHFFRVRHPQTICGRSQIKQFFLLFIPCPWATDIQLKHSVAVGKKGKMGQQGIENGRSSIVAHSGSTRRLSKQTPINIFELQKKMFMTQPRRATTREARNTDFNMCCKKMLQTVGFNHK